MRRALPLLLLVLAVACSPGKPPPTQPPPWGEGDVSFHRAARAKSFYCNGSSPTAAPLEWSDPSALPDDPSQVLVILDPGHGGRYSGRSTHSVCGGSVEIDEDWVNLSLALRMQSFLERAGFHVDLSRYGYYGPFDDKHGNDENANGCVTEALLGVRDKDVCEGPEPELLRRGWNRVWRVEDIEAECKKHFPTAAETRACVERATYFDHKRNKPQSISRYGQIVREFKDAGIINVPFNPDGANLVGSPRVALISLHFNDATAAGAMFTSMIRGIGGGGSSILAPNQAVTKGSDPAAAVSRNLVTSTLEYMLRSLKDSRAMPEAVNKHDLYYWDAGIVRNGAHAQEFDLHGRPGAVFIKNEHMKGKYQKPPKYAGPVTVASGLNPSYTNNRIANIAPKESVITIPNTTLIEVASYIDCANARALAQSLARQNVQSCYNSQSPPAGCPPPPDPTDPIDVAAEDIAHGLVEYYESYVPGFKQKACKNLKNSDWKDHMPDWCTSGGGGGGGGANVPDIDDVRPDSIEVDVWMTDGAASESVEVSFGNVGNADLLATISSDSPIASIGPPDVYPAGTAAPLGGSQSVRVQPGERARVEVGFQCTEAGDYTGSIAIRSNDPDEPEVELPVVVHCHSGVRILVGGYDTERGTFYTSYYDPSNDADEVFYIPETTAVNYVLEADAGWADLSHPEYGFWFTAINNEEEQLEYWLETPEWLTLSPDRGVLQPDESYDLGFTEAQGFCDGPEEKNGYITIHSNDRSNPIVQIPVRLMCGAIEVEFDPKEYNSIEKPLTEWCTSMHGRGVVKGADHLKELFLRIEYEDDEGYEKPVSVEFDTPNMSYLFTKGNWSSIRWPQISGDWNWDEHPVFRFDSWTSSCVFDIGTYEVKDFQYAMFKSPSAGTVTIDNNAFPGAVYDLAERCQDGSCTPLDIKHKIEGAEQPTRELELQHGSWERSTHSFVTGYQYDVDFLDGDTLVDTASGNVGAVLDPEKIIYCTSFTALSSLRTRDGSRVSLAESGDPINLFWGHVVEYDYENRDSYVTETISGAWCYEPWDKEGAGSESKRLRQASAPPWKRGIKPQWVPGEVLFCQKRDCYGHQLESIDDGNPPDW